MLLRFTIVLSPDQKALRLALKASERVRQSIAEFGPHALSQRVEFGGFSIGGLEIRGAGRARGRLFPEPLG
jgi:hypothetical protein